MTWETSARVTFCEKIGPRLLGKDVFKKIAKEWEELVGRARDVDEWRIVERLGKRRVQIRHA